LQQRVACGDRTRTIAGIALICTPTPMIAATQNTIVRPGDIGR
jgi:hypothetical protein